MKLDSIQFINGQVQDFTRLIGDYEVFGRILQAVLEKATRELGIYAIVQSRPKDLVSFVNKCCKKQEEMDRKGIPHRRAFAHSFTDLCGARVIVEYRDQTEAVCAFIRSHFEVDELNSVDPRIALGINTFAYRSDHLIVSLKSHAVEDVVRRMREAQPDETARSHFDAVLARLMERRASLEERDGAVLSAGPKYKAEIQVRTLLEHAWSTLNHDRIYKGDVALPRELTRDMNRISAMLEEADNSFARVVHRVDEYRTYRGRFVDEQQRGIEMKRLQIALEHDSERIEPALDFARLAAQDEKWGDVIKVLGPHIQKWRESPAGQDFHHCWLAFKNTTDASGQKHAQTRLATMSNPRISRALLEYGWARWHTLAAKEALAARDELEQSALLDNRNTEARIRLGQTFAPHASRRQFADTAAQLQHFETAFRAAPGDPQVLGEFLYAKLVTSRTLADLPTMRASLLQAIDICERWAAVGVCLPDAYYLAGFFKLLLEQGQASGTSSDNVWMNPAFMQSLTAALSDYSRAAELTARAENISAHRDRFGVLRAVIEAIKFPGAEWLDLLLKVQCAAKSWANARAVMEKSQQGSENAIRMGETAMAESYAAKAQQAEAQARASVMEQLAPFASRGNSSFADPIVLVVGGCSPESTSAVERYRPHLEAAMEFFRGTVIGGGTEAGVSGIIGKAPVKHPETCTRLSYVRNGPHVNYEQRLLKQQGGNGYLLRFMPGDGFTPLEILQMWTDILAAGINPARVTVCGINGGILSAFELRLALSLGALVGVIRESGGAARDILDDPDWGKHPRLLALPDDVHTVKALFDAQRAARGFTPDSRDLIAEALHDEKAVKRRELNTRRQDRDWDKLDPFYRRDIRERIAYWDVLLEKVGMQLCKEGEVPPEAVAVKSFTPEELELMAEMEHARWNVTRLSGGQRHGKEKQGERMHTDIVPWHQLSKRDQDRDREYVKQMLEAGRFGYSIIRFAREPG